MMDDIMNFVRTEQNSISVLFKFLQKIFPISTYIFTPQNGKKYKTFFYGWASVRVSHLYKWFLLEKKHFIVWSYCTTSHSPIGLEVANASTHAELNCYTRRTDHTEIWNSINNSCSQSCNIGKILCELFRTYWVRSYEKFAQNILI